MRGQSARLVSDQRALFAFLSFCAFALPCYWLLFKGVPNGPESKRIAAMATGALLGLVSGCTLYLVSQCHTWYIRHRTFVLTTFFTSMWILLFAFNLLILSSAQHHDMAQLGAGAVSLNVAQAVAFHMAVPLDQERAIIDTCAVAVAIIAHVRRKPLEP